VHKNVMFKFTSLSSNVQIVICMDHHTHTHTHTHTTHTHSFWPESTGCQFIKWIYFCGM